MSGAGQPPRWMTPPPVYDARSAIPPSSTSLKPYLELPHILSLTWLAYPILSLLFVAFRLQLSGASAQSAVDSAVADLLTACQAAEQAASSAASMPRYLAVAANEQIADAINGTMNDARAALILAITCMEAIINFLIDIYRSTFLCFLDLVVTGALAILIDAVQEITSFLQSTLDSIDSSLTSDAQSVNSAIQSAVDAINSVNPFGTITAPQFNVSSISALLNITIPTDFETALISLNNSLPSVSSIKDSIEDLVDTPFELVQQDINNTFIGLNFNSSVLPVPELSTLSFCSDLDTSSIQDLGNDILEIIKIGTIILIVLALLLLGAHCALEWYKWRCLKHHLENTRRAWSSDSSVLHASSGRAAPTVTMSDHNLLVLQADSQHPLLTRLANWVTLKLHLTPTQHTHLRWFLHYIFHPPALACFLIGFFGLLSVEIQIIAVGPLAAEYSAAALASVDDLTVTITNQINNTMYNQSATYANSINAQVLTVQSTINDGLFGWVNGTTTGLNDTLNSFYDDVQDLVTTLFNGTIFESPIEDFVKCILGSKVEALEEALTFLNENLNVNLPTVNESVLVLSPSDVNEITQPIATAAVGGGSDNSSGLIGDLVDDYVNSLKQERIMFAIFIGLWGVVVLMGLAIVMWHSYGKGWIDAYKKRKWQREQRGGIDRMVLPFRDVQPRQSLPRDVETALEKNEDVEAPPLIVTPPEQSRSHFTLNLLNCSRSSNHPLSSLEPKFEKSWDSFFAHDEQKSGNRFQVATFLRNIKVKRSTTFTQNSSTQREVESEEPPAEESEQHIGWYDRLTHLFHKKERPSSDDSFVAKMSSDRPPLHLTISTDRAPGSGVDIKSPEPKSGWSISPTPASVRWTQSIIAPARNVIPSAMSPNLRSSHRRTASVPYDVSSVYDDSTLLIPKRPEFVNLPPPPLMPVPIHYENRPSPSSTQSPFFDAQLPKPTKPLNFLAPPKDKHKRSSTVPALSIPPPPEVEPGYHPYEQEDFTPVTRILTNNHARRSSILVDPFVTPFDDEASVPPYRPDTDCVNPFTAVAY